MNTVYNAETGALNQETFIKALYAVAAWWKGKKPKKEYDPEYFDEGTKAIYEDLLEEAKCGLDSAMKHSNGANKTNAKRAAKKEKDNASDTLANINKDASGVIEVEVERNKNKNKNRSRSSSGSSLNIIGIRDATDEQTTTTDHSINNSHKTPTLEDVKELARARQSAVDPERFYYYYQANGWTDKKGKPIDDWTALFRMWEKTERPRELKDIEF